MESRCAAYRRLVPCPRPGSPHNLQMTRLLNTFSISRCTACGLPSTPPTSLPYTYESRPCLASPPLHLLAAHTSGSTVALARAPTTHMHVWLFHWEPRAQYGWPQSDETRLRHQSWGGTRPCHSLCIALSPAQTPTPAAPLRPRAPRHSKTHRKRGGGRAVHNARRPAGVRADVRLSRM